MSDPDSASPDSTSPDSASPGSAATRLDVALVGWGAIAKATARLLHERGAAIRIVAVATRSSEPPTDPPSGARHLTDPTQLSTVHADVVVEAAGRDSVAPWGRAALGAGVDFIAASVSALTDTELHASLTALAGANNAQFQITPGALAGVDGLVAANVMGLYDVRHRMVKPPLAWKGTPAEELCDLENLTEATIFFAGTAAEAATMFPKNANVAATTALAGVGLDATAVEMVADPRVDQNSHEITATGAFGEMSIVVRNLPLPDNPKSSALTALSLVRLLENRITPFVV